MRVTQNAQGHLAAMKSAERRDAHAAAAAAAASSYKSSKRDCSPSALRCSFSSPRLVRRKDGTGCMGGLSPPCARTIKVKFATATLGNNTPSGAGSLQIRVRPAAAWDFNRSLVIREADPACLARVWRGGPEN